MFKPSRLITLKDSIFLTCLSLPFLAPVRSQLGVARAWDATSDKDHPEDVHATERIELADNGAAGVRDKLATSPSRNLLSHQPQPQPQDASGCAVHGLSPPLLADTSLEPRGHYQFGATQTAVARTRPRSSCSCRSEFEDKLFKSGTRARRPRPLRTATASLSVLTSLFGAACRGDHVVSAFSDPIYVLQCLADLPGVGKDQFLTSREYFPSQHIGDAFCEPYMESKEYAHPRYGYAGYPGSSDSMASSGSASPGHRFRERGASVSADSDSDHADTHRRPGSRYTVDAHASYNTSLDSMSTAAGRGLGFPAHGRVPVLRRMCAPARAEAGHRLGPPQRRALHARRIPRALRLARQPQPPRAPAPYDPYAPYAATRTPALGDPSRWPQVFTLRGREARGREEAGHGVPLLPRAQDRDCLGLLPRPSMGPSKVSESVTSEDVDIENTPFELEAVFPGRSLERQNMAPYEAYCLGCANSQCARL
ncbi:hypothetical protein GGX14DRAFT_562909 [Mycena pura]|uniref:Uncharacterized protein n=1 Tax=Mycena pura TaxID=153505 RepID=A0AAD6VJM1_9AGAR|nr:hypothetical protein GGX14DRAFT_562909 [Mycena pura]